jgi:hypothetical protein
VEYATGERELYELKQDPHQLGSIADSAEPALLERLSARLRELKSCKGQSCRS